MVLSFKEFKVINKGFGSAIMYSIYNEETFDKCAFSLEFSDCPSDGWRGRWIRRGNA